jgi:hypothetical protein
VAAVLAFNAGVGQGVALLAGYVTGFEGRVLAVSALVGIASGLTFMSGLLDAQKRAVLVPIVRLIGMSTRAESAESAV